MTFPRQKIIDGKSIAKHVLDELKAEIATFPRQPNLTAILVGDDPASQIYVNMKQKRASEIGIRTNVIRLPKDTTQDRLHDVIQELNLASEVDGILLQLPLPQHLDANLAISLINPEKDVDGLNYINSGKLHMGLRGFNPCTPLGVIELLERSQVNIEGSDAVVVGRSNLVGKPLARLLEQKNATVTLCHSKTKNLKHYTRFADIVVSAVGKPNTITADMVKDGCVVIDVGITRTPSGLKGDVDFDMVVLKASKITPVPGGVGPMTIAMLMKNTVEAYKGRVL
ncbi:MAG: bifunctional methylenetetrahydrofolate dehydrogenase/methenyltetrahydrofolate cyclohydrolase FolD [Methanobacteriota archaeon]|nr:MAG: bifunctional methylenetetrahydrofolate dehydrogenase/methenyltetrahydrofolate cyclohydrolase FolD [Euryarchaeota archaeon]